MTLPPNKIKLPSDPNTPPLGTYLQHRKEICIPMFKAALLPTARRLGQTDECLKRLWCIHTQTHTHTEIYTQTHRPSGRHTDIHSHTQTHESFSATERDKILLSASM